MSEAKAGSRVWLRELWWIVALGLLVQGFWAARLQHPTYFDAYYYTTNGQRLAAGQGFSEEIIWQYLDEPQALPTPSHTYWMPLASLIAAAGYALGGSFRAAQAPFWLMAGLLPLLAYAISWQLYGQMWQARLAALFTMAGGYYAAYWVQPATFAPFAWAGGGCLLALALARREAVEGNKAVGNRGNAGRWWLVAGIGAGLAHLTRADGLLIVAVAGLIWLFAARELWQAQRPKGAAQAALLLGLGYLLVMGPWFLRTWRLSGAPLSTIGTQTIFLTIYDDLFAYGRHFDLQQYLAWGWGNIVRSKLETAWLSLQTFVVVIGLTVFGFFALLAWWKGRSEAAQRRFLQPAAWYAVVLFLAMSLVFTFPAQRGSLLHSSTALWPWSMALAPAGIEQAVLWIAARRPRWRPRTATRFFGAAFVLMAFVITLAAASSQPLHREAAAVYAEVGSLLPADAVVMTGDPPGLHYHSGLRAVVTPNEPPQTMLRAARQFGASYLLMDADHPAPLRALYEGRDAVKLPLLRDFGDGFRLYELPLEAGEP